MHIKGKKTVLRAVEEHDLRDLQRWANDPDLQSCLGGWHFPVSALDQARWLETLSFNSVNQRFIVHVEGTGPVGTTNLVSIDWQNRSAFHGLLIGERSLHGSGIATDALMALMRFAFDEMGLYRLDTDIIEYNAASLKFYTQKCGWRREGVRKGWYYRKGRRWDKIIVGITCDDYAALCNRTGYWSPAA